MNGPDQGIHHRADVFRHLLDFITDRLRSSMFDARVELVQNAKAPVRQELLGGSLINGGAAQPGGSTGFGNCPNKGSSCVAISGSSGP